MRSVPHRVLLAAFLLTCASPVEVSAQSPATCAASLGCTYTTCGLRIERSLFSERLVRGAAGEAIGTLGLFGGGVDVLLTGSDSAVVHAQSYVWNERRSAIIGGAGVAAVAVAFVRTNHFQTGRVTNGDVVTVIAGALATWISVPFELHARRELARAIWWYNGALPR